MTKSDELADDLLEGAAEIAQHMFGDASQRRRIYYLSDPARGPDRLPVFRLGSGIYARRSTLARWIEDRERTAAANVVSEAVQPTMNGAPKSR